VLGGGPPPLKEAAPGVFNPPAASGLAHGLNIGTVVSVQNHWREFYNPLPALNIQRARALFDFSRRGLNAELQNVYREMEGLYPTLMGLIERRTSPLLEMNWACKPAGQLPKGASQGMAEDQAAALREAYEGIDNLYEAIEWLELGAFRGYAHLEKIYANPGTTDLTVEHLEPVEQWHWTRKSMYAEWEYVAAATQTNIGAPIHYEQFVINEARRPLDRVALVLWVRASLCEKDWDAFIEIYGVPHWVVFMPPHLPKEKEPEYLAAADIIAQGGNGTLPHGSDLKSADKPRDSNPFRPRLDWLQEQLVLAGTGGLLSMLSMPTGIGHGATTAHEDAFKKISKMEARKISGVLNCQFDRPWLAREFPGQPALARFELCANEETDVSGICAQTLQLSQAGYQVDAAQLSRQTGYNLTAKPNEP
jgi:phage gp29-like protein